MKKNRGRSGRTNSPEHRAKCSRALKGRILSPEHCAIIGRASKGRIHSSETKAKIGRALKGRKLSSEHKKKISQSHIGLYHTEETKHKLHLIFTGRKQSIESRRKQSKRICENIAKGTFCPNTSGISGTFHSRKNNQDLHYRSLLERDWYRVFEKDSKVKRFSVEPVTIPYLWNGYIRHYLPDLRVRYTDGTTELIEVKPESRWREPQNLAKWDAATEWCKTRPVPTTFRVVGYNV